MLEQVKDKRTQHDRWYHTPMADSAALLPSFRDFSIYFRGQPTGPQSAKAAIPKPTVLEVEHILEESTAGQPVNFEGWPWLERMEFLQDAIPGIRVHSLGGIAPFEADGIWGPYEWYYRERGGGADLWLAPIATFPGAQAALYSSGAEVKEFAGSAGWITRFLKLWERLERSPYLYEFSAREVYLRKTEWGIVPFVTGEVTTQAGWGHTPDEAWLNVASYIPYFEEQRGWTRELQAERRELMDISKQPLNKDERVYSKIAPDFTVNWDGLAVPKELSNFL
jgi:hypothetical protein